MDPVKFQLTMEIFDKAVELDPESRGSYLDERCAGDPDLRGEVEAMLAADCGSGELLDGLIPDHLSPDPFSENLVGTRLGQYEIVRIISSGGMGTVYEAVQEHPRRNVALKVMKRGIASGSALRRFEYESRILARLKHPGVAQVYDAGTYDPDGDGESVPYFAMEFIQDARTITEYADGLDIEGRLALFNQVCEAIEHGHQKGIIHRDIKPANILVDSAGLVKVIDFGVARATDSDLALTTVKTDVGQLIGTLQYMSPEQCEADSQDLDIRSDVYSLGIVLYKLLCEELPYDVRQLSVYEAVKRIKDAPPKKPSTLFKYLRGDLETIILKALEKDKDQRYRSAGELRTDIVHFLKREPITARPPTVLYQFKTFARRNKVLVGGVAAVFIVLLAGVITSTSLYLKARRESEMARSISSFFDSTLASVDPLQLNLVSGFEVGGTMTPAASGSFSSDISLVEMMRAASERVEVAFADKPELEATVRARIGMTLAGMGHSKEALPQLSRVYEIRKERLGELHRDTLTSQFQLGFVMRGVDRKPDGLKLLRDVHPKMQTVLGADHPNTLTCATVLANALSNADRLLEAASLYRRTLDTAERSLGPEDRITLWIRCEWAFWHLFHLEVRQARETVEPVHEITHRKNSGHLPDDYIRVYSETLLGICHCFREEHEVAVPMLQPTLERMRRTLGNHHPKTHAVMWGLARCLAGVGRLQEAEHLFRESLNGFLEIPGPDSRWTTVSIEAFSGFLAAQGRFDEAVGLYRNYLATCLETLGEKNKWTLVARKKLANLLLSSGALAEGRAMLHSLVEAFEAMFGPEHPKTLDAMADAAGKLYHSGLSEDAQAMLSEAARRWKNRVSLDSATATDFAGYARILLTDQAEGIRDMDAALEMALKAVKVIDHYDTQVLDTLARAYLEAGRNAEALGIQVHNIDNFDPIYRYWVWDLESLVLRIHLRQGDDESVSKLFSDRKKRMLEQLGLGKNAIHGRKQENLWLLVEEGWYETAEKMVRRCIAEDTIPHWNEPKLNIMMCKSLLGRCLAETGEHASAEPYLLEAWQWIENHPLAPMERQNKVQGWVVELYEDWGDPEQAARWRDERTATD